ncbi:MAG: RloB family protein [Muribaculaceae bacterium]|nr:RloB family protein [Muribaculaceae bacterium]
MMGRRYKKERELREIFLVFCEGQTEKEYVEVLKRYYRLPITIKTKVSGANITQRFVNQCVKELALTPNEKCSIFYMYDADVEAVTERLTGLRGTAVLSNPCMEFWFILHSKDFVKRINSSDAIKVLAQSGLCWKSYKKGYLSSEQQKMLIDKRHDAVKRANKLQYPNNPSSNIYKFIELLERVKID